MSATPAQVAAATMAFDDALASLGLTPADVPTLQQRYAGMRAALDTLAAPAAGTQGADVAADIPIWQRRPGEPNPRKVMDYLTDHNRQLRLMQDEIDDLRALLAAGAPVESEASK